MSCSEIVSECFSMNFGVFPLSGRETMCLVNSTLFETVSLSSAFRLPLVLWLPRRGSSDVFAVGGGNLSVWSIVDAASLEKTFCVHVFSV